MGEKLAAGLGEWEIALVDGDEVPAGEVIGDAALPAGACLGPDPIDDDGDEAAADCQMTRSSTLPATPGANSSPGPEIITFIGLHGCSHVGSAAMNFGITTFTRVI